MNKKKQFKKDQIIGSSSSSSSSSLWETNVLDTYKSKGMDGLATLFRKAATQLRGTLRQIEKLNLEKTRLANMLLQIEEIALEKENTRFTHIEEDQSEKKTPEEKAVEKSKKQEEESKLNYQIPQIDSDAEILEAVMQEIEESEEVKRKEELIKRAERSQLLKGMSAYEALGYQMNPSALSSVHLLDKQSWIRLPSNVQLIVDEKRVPAKDDGKQVIEEELPELK